MELLLLSHVVLFSLSLVTTASGTVLSAVGRHVPRLVVASSFILMLLGTGSGVLLLFSKPLGIYCAALFTYVAVFAFAQQYMIRRNQLLAASPEA